MKFMKLGGVFAVFSALGAAAFFCSCGSCPEWEDEWVTQDIVASRAAKDQIKIDGIVSPGEWDDAQDYQLARAQNWGYGAMPPRRRAKVDQVPFERGYFKVKYDDDFLYVLGSFKDSDLVQTGRKDQEMSFRTGDTAEVFLKPEAKNAFWEIHGTPWSCATTLFYPWIGYSHNGQQTTLHEGIRTAAAVDGTLNSGEGEDSGWIIEMAIPRELIEKTGEKFEPGREWRILLCRYNYGGNLPFPQISSTPRLPRTNHHLTEYYGKLKFKE